MVRTYSSELIVLGIETSTSQDQTFKTVVVAADNINNKERELKISFYGKSAAKASTLLAKGTRFTYRGYVTSDHEGNMELVGVRITPIA